MTGAAEARGNARRLPALATAMVVACALWAGSPAAQEPAIAEEEPTAATEEPAAARTPIDITADSLQIQQDTGTAVFIGDVRAVQVDMTLTADKLTVHYREAENDEEELGVERIEAEGHVFVTSPGRTAQGRSGVYDVDNGLIDLAGDVVLTQGEHVISGKTLHMNLETGESRISGGGEGDRVQSLFVPGAE